MTTRRETEVPVATATQHPSRLRHHLPPGDVDGGRLRALALGVLVIAVCAAVGGAIGLTRTPTYTSSIDVAVGGNGLGGSSVPGYVQAIETLAGNYSRAIKRPSITDPIAAASGLSSGQVASRLSATPIPNSSIIRLDVTGDDEDSTIALANTAGEEFVKATAKDTAQTTGQLPLKLVREAELAVLKARRTLRQVRARTASDTSNAVLDAEAALSAQEVRADTLRTQYGQTRQSTVPVGLEVVRPTTSATSDRKRTLILYLLLGGLIGSVIVLGTRAVRTGPLT